MWTLTKHSATCIYVYAAEAEGQSDLIGLGSDIVDFGTYKSKLYREVLGKGQHLSEPANVVCPSAW